MCWGCTRRAWRGSGFSHVAARARRVIAARAHSATGSGGGGGLACCGWPSGGMAGLKAPPSGGNPGPDAGPDVVLRAPRAGRGGGKPPPSPAPRGGSPPPLQPAWLHPVQATDPPLDSVPPQGEGLPSILRYEPS